MRTFRCSCGQLLFFENFSCVGCGAKLGFLPDAMQIAVIAPTKEGPHWNSNGRLYKKCPNYLEEDVCNWMVAADDPCEFCVACRLNEVIPDLRQPMNRQRWAVVETAKRRLVYTLLQLKLPLRPKTQDATGLSFQFLADSRIDPSLVQPVLTGHVEGVITINLAEADDVEREKVRSRLREPFRTLLGHFRHEVGHYYWDRLIRRTKWLSRFRQMFGDETADYARALDWHYQTGPSPNWNQHFISPYASSHPWEDWAETWAHYLHMHDALETAHDVGLGGKPFDASEGGGEGDEFQLMTDEWSDVAVAINSLNRSLGLRDAYPFVIAAPVLEKLRFIHEVVRENVKGER